MLFETMRRNPRTAVVGARVTIAERDMLVSAAIQRGMTVTALVRAALGDYLKVSEMKPHDLSKNET